MGTFYVGVGTVTEAAAMGVIATVLIALCYRSFSIRKVGEALVGTSLICATIGFIMMGRSEEHTSELQSLMRISYAVFCMKNKIVHSHVYSKQNLYNTLLLHHNQR